MSVRTQQSLGIRLAIFCWAGAIAFSLDQLTKRWVLSNIPAGSRRPFIPGVLDLFHVQNDGAAFSIGSGRPLFFAALTAVVVLGMVYAVMREKNLPYPLIAILGLVAGGGIGNGLERAARRRDLERVLLVVELVSVGRRLLLDLVGALREDARGHGAVLARGELEGGAVGPGHREHGVLEHDRVVVGVDLGQLDLARQVAAGRAAGFSGLIAIRGLAMRRRRIKGRFILKNRARMVRRLVIQTVLFAVHVPQIDGERPAVGGYLQLVCQIDCLNLLSDTPVFVELDLEKLEAVLDITLVPVAAGQAVRNHRIGKVSLLMVDTDVPFGLIFMTRYGLAPFGQRLVLKRLGPLDNHAAANRLRIHRNGEDVLGVFYYLRFVELGGQIYRALDVVLVLHRLGEGDMHRAADIAWPRGDMGLRHDVSVDVFQIEVLCSRAGRELHVVRKGDVEVVAFVDVRPRGAGVPVHREIEPIALIDCVHFFFIEIQNLELRDVDVHGYAAIGEGMTPPPTTIPTARATARR